VFPRVNEVSSDMFHKDVSALLTQDSKYLIHGFMVPKVNTSSDMQQIDEYLLQHEKKLKMPDYNYKLMVLFETTEGFSNIKKILKGRFIID